MINNIFYVYEHWRTDRQECFYVGKGKGKRANDMAHRNMIHKFIQNKLYKMGYAVEVKIVKDHLTEEEAFKIERERIAIWRADGADLANITDGGEGSSGFKFTDEQKRNISKKLKGRILSENHKKKIGSFHKGKKWYLGRKKTPESIAKSASKNTGKKRSEETKEKLRKIRINNPTFKGKKHTEETIEKIRSANAGKKRTESTKEKMRKPKSESHKQKLALINTGKSHTEETRRLLSEKAKNDWARRKSALVKVEF
jgi:hypothetical protein